MATLYVTEPGARIEKEYQRILVSDKDDQRLFIAPLSQVSDVVLIGSVGVTTPALMALLEAGVGLSLISAAGQLRGRLQPAVSKNMPLRRRQYQRGEETEFCLGVARAIVLAKLHNQRTLALRLCRSRPEIDPSGLERIAEAMRLAESAPDLATLRGQEGQGAKAYFSIFRQAVRPEWDFEKRSRRPPANPLNALLSLGYTLLSQNLMTALELAGLDPYEGFFHADQYGRPALALDLEEEFRSLIVDAVVLTVVNRRMLKVDDFQPGPGKAIWLKPHGLRKFLTQYSRRLHTLVFHPLAGRKLSYQKIFEVQARQLRKVIEGQEPNYRPFRTR